MKYARVTCSAFFVVALAALLVTNAYGQGAVTTSLSGTVTDTSGAVIPGADVQVKNNETGATFAAVTGANGVFTIPALNAGSYTVTVALMGFKTWTAKDVVLNAAVPGNVKAVLELGKLEETVVVEGAAQIVQTQTSAIASTISSKQITNLPGGRDAFGVIQLMPGVSSATSARYGTVNGLPQAAVNITLDGMNIQDNYLKTTDGMFTRVSPRIDAVEEVTVGTAAQGADLGGQGGVQVRFVTRSGTNQYRGSIYHYLQRDWMNTNTWFNIHRNVDAAGNQQSKPVVTLHQPGGRIGGPIIIPGLFDGHDKAFFFVNYEVSYSPGTSNLTRTIMSPESERGLFVYSKGSVDLLDLARRNGYTNTVDPTVNSVLAAIRASTSKSGSVNANPGDPLTQTYAWQFPTKGRTDYPTVRLDYNVTTKHRLTGSYTRNHLISDPDTLNGYYRNFPGFATHGKQDSYRYTGQFSVRSTITANMVNEVRLGGTGGATYFMPELNSGMFAGQTPDMNGYAIRLDSFRSINNPYSAYTNSSREASTRVVEDTLSWIRGKHSMSLGTSFTQADVWLANQQYVPRINFGIVQGDPADGMFTTANFPGASSTDLANARALYSILTGRVSNIERNARIAPDGEQYVILGPSMQKGRLRQFGFFLQDSWKLNPALTVNAGLRYDVQYPFYSLNNSYSTSTLDDIFGNTGLGSGFVPGATVSNIGNLFKPGATGGKPTTYQMLTAKNYGYNVDKNNFAPSIGVAWKLPQPKGILGKVTGEDAVIRTGYNVSYQRGGMNDFTSVFGSNPGVVIDASRNQNLGNLGSLPVLLRSSDVGAPPISLTRNYPMSASVSSSVNIFDPDITVPYATTFSVGMQRAITKSMAFEVRYVRTTADSQWRTFNYNEVNIVENNFLNEFRLAQQNLVANGGKSFAYTGAGTNQLPIMLAFLSGKDASQAASPSAYSGSGWTNSSYLTYLYGLNPNPVSMASSLQGNATYRGNAIKAGLPANFFVANPDISSGYVTSNGQDTRYNGLQLILNRRFSAGLQLQANYSFGKGYQTDFYSFHKPYVWTEQNYNNGTGNSYGNIRHVFAANWVYELPFGQGKRFAGNVNRQLNRLVGNWSFMGTARLQSGRLIDLGNVRLFGMTKEQAAKMMQIRFEQDPSNQYRTLTYYWPADVIDNTIKAYSFNANGYTLGAPSGRYFAPANGPDCIEIANGYGDCGARNVIISGPPIIRVDMSIGKDILVTSRLGFQFQLQVFNVFNRVNFNPITMPSASNAINRTNYEVTGATDQSRTMQMAFRINW